MTNFIAFDTGRYIEAQSEAIHKALQDKTDCLVVEFGGKVIQDRHASRVLPGYHEDAKLELVKTLLPSSEVIFAISAKDIVGGRIRGDFKTRYDVEALRSLDELAARGLEIHHIALTRLLSKFEQDSRIIDLIAAFEKRGCEVHRFYEIEDYLTAKDITTHLDKNSYVSSEKPILVVVSPGGGSGKFNVCLSQLYHQMKNGKTPFYLKLETFPVHDLPLSHPLHLAFMAASADFFDQVTLDAKHHIKATSYNRDQENYELLHRIAELYPKEGERLRTITSATNMGVNRLTQGIVDEEIIIREACAEVARRFARYVFEERRGEATKETVERARQILKTVWESL